MSIFRWVRAIRTNTKQIVGALCKWSFLKVQALVAPKASLETVLISRRWVKVHCLKNQKYLSTLYKTFKATMQMQLRDNLRIKLSHNMNVRNRWRKTKLSQIWPESTTPHFQILKMVKHPGKCMRRKMHTRILQEVWKEVQRLNSPWGILRITRSRSNSWIKVIELLLKRSIFLKQARKR